MARGPHPGRVVPRPGPRPGRAARRDGRHPLPSADDFEAAARRAGIGEDTLVVAYDEAGEGGAARLWWLLRHFGHDEVTVLDGGMRAWREEGGELSAGEEQIAAGDFTATTSPNDTATAEELATDRPAEPPATDRALLDARAPERYRGEVEPVDPVAGHIPGAVNVPFAELAPGGRFLPPAEPPRPPRGGRSAARWRRRRILRLGRNGSGDSAGRGGRGNRTGPALPRLVERMVRPRSPGRTRLARSRRRGGLPSSRAYTANPANPLRAHPLNARR